MLQTWDQILGDVVETARRTGELARHPAHGLPLRLEPENPLADPATRLAHKLLRDAGYTLPWIADARAIDEGLTRARHTLARARFWMELDRAEGKPERGIAVRWQQAEETFRERVARLNNDIFQHNLRVPIAALHRLPVDVEDEVQRIKTGGFTEQAAP